MQDSDEPDCVFVVEDVEAEDAVLELDTNREIKVRLDKWLWAARFFKTRALARIAVEDGKVLYNNERVKPTIEIELNSVVTIMQNNFVKTVVITGLSTRRKSSDETVSLYEEKDVIYLEESKDAETIDANNGKGPRFLRRSRIDSEQEQFDFNFNDEY